MMATDRVKLEVAAQMVARAIDETLPRLIGTADRVGFAVFVFDFGDGGNLAYCSNADRTTMISAVKEWLARQEAGLTTDPPGSRAEG